MRKPRLGRQAKKERARRRSVSFGHENRAAMKSLTAQQEPQQRERRLSVSFKDASEAVEFQYFSVNSVVVFVRESGQSIQHSVVMYERYYRCSTSLGAS